MAAGGRIAAGLDSVIGLSAGAVGLERENRRLRIEIARLRAESTLLEEDLEALREAVELVAIYDPEEPPVLARATYRHPAAGRMELRLPGGVAAAPDAAVVAADGVLGRVVAGGYGRCTVQLLRHPASAVAVRADSSGVEGLAVGTGAPLLGVEFVPRTAAVLRGELLRSSGADGIFPPGIPVARVRSVEESDSAFLEIVAEPTADPRRCRVALLVASWRTGIGGSR